MEFPILSDKGEENKKQSLEADPEASVFMVETRREEYGYS